MLDMIATMGVRGRDEHHPDASSVWIAPYRHPLVAAHQFATVDVLSDGRLIVGVGSGWDPQEFAAVGGDFEHRGSVTEEQIEIFKHAWSAPYLDFRGRFYEIRDVSLEPKPVQQPHPPIVFGAVTDAGARRAARTSDGIYPMFLDSYGDPHRFEHLREAVLREAERIDRDVSGFRMYAFCSGLVVEAGDEAAARSPRMTLTGTSDQVLADVERFAAAGYSHLTMHFDVRSGTMAEYLEIVQRFAEDVLPRGARDHGARVHVASAAPCARFPQRPATCAVSRSSTGPCRRAVVRLDEGLLRIELANARFAELAGDECEGRLLDEVVARGEGLPGGRRSSSSPRRPATRSPRPWVSARSRSASWRCRPAAVS